MKNKEQLKKQSKATASFKQYKKDVYLQTITRTVTLSCNKSGNLGVSQSLCKPSN